MFFDIKKQIDLSFPCHFVLTDQLVLNCDQGWQEFRNENSRVIYKGYNNTNHCDRNFANLISQDPTPQHLGNFFAVIVYDDYTVQTTSDLYRGTPLFRSQTDFSITNLPTKNIKSVWSNKTLKIDNDLAVTEVPHDPLIHLMKDCKLSDDQIIDAIDKIINEHFESFLTKNTKPIKIFLSGGMDTTMCFAYLKKFTKDYEIIASNQTSDVSRLMQTKHDNFARLWGYQQIHHFNKSCVLVSGSHGDEMMLRGPTTANMILSTMNTDLLTEVNLDCNNYHYHYFNQPMNTQLVHQQKSNKHFNILTKYRHSTVKHILTNLSNDHQHWHLEHTLTFTPFKDLRYADLILQGSNTLIKNQATNAIINRQLIERHAPDLLSLVTKQKNKPN